METYENAQENQDGMRNLSTQQIDPRIQQPNDSENDMMSSRGDDMNEDMDEEIMADEDMDDEDMDDDEMQEDDPAAGTTVGGR